MKRKQRQREDKKKTLIYIFVYLKMALKVVKSKTLHTHNSHNRLWCRFCKLKKRLIFVKIDQVTI